MSLFRFIWNYGKRLDIIFSTIMEFYCQVLLLLLMLVLTWTTYELAGGLDMGEIHIRIRLRKGF